MFKTPSHLTLLILATIALEAGTAFAQEPAPPGGRFLDLLHPGQRVRLAHMRGDADGIELTLVSDAEWQRIEQGAEKNLQNVKELEEKLDTLREQAEEAETLVRESSSPSPRRGIDFEAFQELREAELTIRREMRQISEELSQLRWQLPSNTSRVEIVGEDYFGLDNGNAVVFYPASRLREITQPKKTQPSAAAEQPASPESSDAEPAEDAGVETEASTESAAENPSSANKADVEN